MSSVEISERTRSLPVGVLLLLAGGLLALPCACTSPDADPDAGAPPFELFVWGNAHSADVELWIDGEPTTLQGTQNLTTAQFDSYQDGVDRGVTLETRDPDGTVIDRCVLHAGACQGECDPARETVGICVDSDQQISLTEWDCPCDNHIADYSCTAACSLTGPQ